VIVGLFRGDTLIAVLDTTASSGAYEWTVHSRLPLGSDYRILLRSSIDSTVFDFSNGGFSIVAAAAPAITVTAPRGGEQYPQGSTQRIRWKNNVGEDVVVSLFKEDTLVAVLDTTAGSEAYEWFIPLDFPLGSGFRICVRSSIDSTVFAFSEGRFSIIDPIQFGDNALLNGDFSEGSAHWSFQISGDAAAAGGGDAEGRYRIAIENSGSESWYIQLKQEGVKLLVGRKYRFEFDGCADSARTIDAKVEKSSSPWTNYGEQGEVLLGKGMEHFAYDFTMKDSSDDKARVVFNCGQSTIGICLDNISLKEMNAPAKTEAPALLAPPDSGTVNPNLPVKLIWSSIGLFSEFHLQMATDSGFGNPAADREHLTDAYWQPDTLKENTVYYWRVRATGHAGVSDWSRIFTFKTVVPSIIDTTTSADLGVSIVHRYALHQNYPNPFNPETTIAFELAKNGFVTLTVYDMLGHEVKTLVSEFKPAGGHSVTWDSRTFPSGMYFYRLETGSFSRMRKMVLMK